MKHIYALIAALMVGTASFAQLPDGSIAPDFTATDINGVEHNLYTTWTLIPRIWTSPPRGAALAGATTPAEFL